MSLPRKLTRPKMGARPQIVTVWPRHRRWVRSHGCCVPGCAAPRVEFAHLRKAANAGMAKKPHDAFGISLCRDHHEEQHRVGVVGFSKKYRIDLWALAAEFTRRSPDQAMRASLALTSANVPPIDTESASVGPNG